MGIPLTEKITVEIAILCEDVRQEIGQKVSLMGVFTGDVIVGELPAQIRSAFLFSLRSTTEGNFPLKIRIVSDDATASIMEGAAQLEFHHPDMTSNTVVPLGFIRFENAATMTVELSVKGGPWVSVIRKRVYQGPISSRSIV